MSDVVYHYTDPKGLIGILTSGQFWATDIRYVNDSSEQVHAEGIFEGFLNQLEAEYADKHDEKTILHFCRVNVHRTNRRRGGPVSPSDVEENEEGIESETAPKRMWLNEGFAEYVVCFSEEDDCVTQWNTYGSRGSGFSIGFDRENLSKAVQPRPATNWMAGVSPGVELVKVRYSEDEQVCYLRELWDKARERYYDNNRRFRTVLNLDDCAKTVVREAALSASRFKHPCFEWESEWRIIVKSPGFGLDLAFRPSRRTVVPYIKIPDFRGVDQEANRRLPVKSITIGPTLHQELSVGSVEALLWSKDYRGVEIRKSQLPLVLTD